MGLMLLDTNVLVDHFNGVAQASIEIAFHSDIAISSITQLEVAVGLNANDASRFTAMIELLPVAIIHPDDDIIREATRIRKTSIEARRAGAGSKIPTPDAIILATANVTGRQIITRNPADFGMAMRSVRVPYRLQNGVVSEIASPPPP